jgi:hypothetical protein
MDGMGEIIKGSKRRTAKTHNMYPSGRVACAFHPGLLGMWAGLGFNGLFAGLKEIYVKG